MRYRTIGNTGVRVSEIGFGCGNTGALMVQADYATQKEAVRYALEGGINYFDTAYAYGRGKSEENLGRILRDLGADPVISTKIRLEADALSDLRAAAERAVEAALKRLGRGRVDVIQLHTRVTTERRQGGRFTLTPQEVLGPGGVLEGFKTMRDRGWVGWFGFSGLGDVPALRELVESGEFHAFQAYYNMLNPSAGQPVPGDFRAHNYDLLIDRAAAMGMGAFVIRVLAAGALTGTPEEGDKEEKEPMSPGSEYGLDRARAEKVREALRIEKKDLARTAMRFALMKPEVSTVLVGFSGKAHIAEALAAAEEPGLPEEQMRVLREMWQHDFGGL